MATAVSSPPDLSPPEMTVAFVQVALGSRAESENIDLWERLALAIERETLPIIRH